MPDACSFARSSCAHVYPTSSTCRSCASLAVKVAASVQFFAAMAVWTCCSSALGLLQHDRSGAHFGIKTGEDAMEGSVAALTQFLVRLLDVVRHQHRFTHPGVVGNLTVDVFAASGVLQGRLPERVDVGFTIAVRFRPLDHTLVKPVAEVLRTVFGRSAIDPARVSRMKSTR